ncbi:YopX family protein [Paenibacillus sp. FSL K6-0276]|uniref:YopX family protein n=1 Tax=Paenibacillus sp. FSL K6-0276 TaxID=2921450 RepID=UPI0030EDE244
MNRDIKFRGKSTETNEFIYGSLVQVSRAGSLAIAALDDKGYLKLQEIIKGTEGQYIGRGDDEGKELYEGQRVKFTNLSLGRFSENEQWAEGVIAYNVETSGFYISQGKDSGWNLRESSVIALDDDGEAAKT